ncbi:hypothetical protein H4R24_003665, partial [Coemansia sp. RSA 988]
MSDEKSGTATSTDVGRSRRSSSITERPRSVGSVNNARGISEKHDEPELLDDANDDQ